MSALTVIAAIWRLRFIIALCGAFILGCWVVGWWDKTQDLKRERDDLIATNQATMEALDAVKAEEGQERGHLNRPRRPEVERGRPAGPYKTDHESMTRNWIALSALLLMTPWMAACSQTVTKVQTVKLTPPQELLSCKDAPRSHQHPVPNRILHHIGQSCERLGVQTALLRWGD